MSLKVWLPLNGNLNNQGCSPLKPVQSTTPIYVNGKIGQAMSTGAFYLPAAEVAKFYNNNGMSWAFWLYPTTSESTATPIIGQFNMAAGDNRMFTIFQYQNGTSIHLSWQSETANNSVFLQTEWHNILTVNAWNHVAITYDGTTATLYVDGTKKGTTTGVSTRTNFNYDVPIPNASCRYLNDFRIYDHCLSPKEVKEIAKGLVIHYPLDGNGKGNDNLFQNSFINTTSSNYGFGTITVNVIQGKTYTISAKGYISEAAANSGTNLSIFCYKPDWSYTPVALGFYSTTPEVKYVTFTASQTTTMQITSYSFKTQGQPGDPVTTIWYKAEEGSEHTPWCPNSSDALYTTLGYNSTTEYDTSGFRNNGTKVGTFNISSDTPRYSNSSNYDGSSCIKKTNFNIGNIWSYGIWYKSNNLSSGWQAIVLLNLNGGDTDTQLGFYTCHANNWLQSTANGAYNARISCPHDTNWHHYFCTYNGSTMKTYLDGILIDTTTITNALLSKSNLVIGAISTNSGATTFGSYFTGQLSDFRLYATVLSADDIKELYESSASIANNGTMFGYEFNEE